MSKRILSEVEKQAKILEHNAIERIKRQIRKENSEHLKRRTKVFKRNYQTIIKLQSIGLIDDSYSTSDIEYAIRYGESIEVSPSQFPLLRTVFPMVKATENKEIVSAETGVVKVYLQLEKDIPWPTSGEVRVYYLVVLDNNSKCKIVTEVSTSTYSSLVCQR